MLPRGAWTASDTGRRTQALAISLAHNLPRLFHARLKREENIEDTKVINAWRKDLAKQVATVHAFPADLLQGRCGGPVASHAQILATC